MPSIPADVSTSRTCNLTSRPCFRARIVNLSYASPQVLHGRGDSVTEGQVTRSMSRDFFR